MSKGVKISSEVKERVMGKIKEEGMRVAEAAASEGVKAKTVYKWLSKEAEKTGVSITSHNKLKREVKQLKEIIGHLTLEMHKPKKS